MQTSDWNAPVLGRSMAAGAIYDLILGASIVLALEPLSFVLPIPFPAQPFYARVVGILLIGLGAFYGVAALDIRRNIRSVGAAIFVRTLGGLYLALYAAIDASVSWFFLVFGLGDLFWAAIHYWLLRKETPYTFLRLLTRGPR